MTFKFFLFVLGLVVAFYSFKKPKGQRAKNGGALPKAEKAKDSDSEPS